MTHQEIAAEIEALNTTTEGKRKDIDKWHRIEMDVIRKRCERVGHIFTLSMTFSILGSEPQDSYSCAVCGARRTTPTLSGASD